MLLQKEHRKVLRFHFVSQTRRFFPPAFPYIDNECHTDCSPQKTIARSCSQRNSKREATKIAKKRNMYEQVPAWKEIEEQGTDGHTSEPTTIRAENEGWWSFWYLLLTSKFSFCHFPVLSFLVSLSKWLCHNDHVRTAFYFCDFPTYDFSLLECHNEEGTSLWELRNNQDYNAIFDCCDKKNVGKEFVSCKDSLVKNAVIFPHK